MSVPGVDTDEVPGYYGFSYYIKNRCPPPSLKEGRKLLIWYMRPMYSESASTVTIQT
jgi:hypothetical protein